MSGPTLRAVLTYIVPALSIFRGRRRPEPT
jgi:hypothetical protein